MSEDLSALGRIAPVGDVLEGAGGDSEGGGGGGKGGGGGGDGGGGATGDYSVVFEGASGDQRLGGLDTMRASGDVLGERVREVAVEGLLHLSVDARPNERARAERIYTTPTERLGRPGTTGWK